MIKQQLAERFTLVREELAKQSGEKWPMRRVAQQVGISQNMIERIEAGRGGMIEAYVALLTFYHSKGFNVNWMILPDISAYPQKRIDQDGQVIAIEELNVRIEKVKEQVNLAFEQLLKDSPAASK